MTAQIIPGPSGPPDDVRIHELRTARLRYRFDGRALDEGHVKNLMDTMRRSGFWNSAPLRVRPIKIRELNDGNIDGWEITTGRHRFEAAWRLNYETVPCVIVPEDDLHAEKSMIEENLFRRDLNPVDQAKQTARLKVIYKELYPETAHGGDRKSSSRKISDSNRFSKETAAKTGRSESSVQKDARRGEVLGDDLNDIIGTSLDKGIELDALVKMAAPARREIIGRAKAGEKVSAADVSEAKLKPIPSGAFSADSSGLAQLKLAWSKATVLEQERFIVWLSRPSIMRKALLAWFREHMPDTPDIRVKVSHRGNEPHAEISWGHCEGQCHLMLTAPIVEKAIRECGRAAGYKDDIDYNYRMRRPRIRILEISDELSKRLQAEAEDP